MTGLKIVSDDHPMLKTELVPFDFTNPPTDPTVLSTELQECMIKYGGIGLSANQCGLPYRVFVMKSDPLTICFNPRIVDESTEMIAINEGCLSFPSILIKNIKRAAHIKVRYQDALGETHTQKYSGLTARVFLHELDHMNGITFFKRASFIEYDKAKRSWKKQKRVVEIRRKLGFII